MSVNSAARRCATSRAPSSTTTAPMTARLTYSSSSTGAAALSPARNGDRIEGIWEVTDTVNGLTLPETGWPTISGAVGRPTIPGTISVAPEETRLPTLAASPPAWPAVSRPSVAAYPQVTSISSVPSLDSISGSAPGPMKTAPIQYGR